MKNIFTIIKRKIRNNLEIKKWYFKRDTQESYFDEDSNKYIKPNKKWPAKDVLLSTWEGESDILNIMLLKIDHMIVNLRKYGVEADNYIDSFNFLKKEVPEEDRHWAIKYIFNRYLGSYKNAKANCSKWNFEEWCPKGQIKGTKLWKARLFIGNALCAKTQGELDEALKLKEAGKKYFLTDLNHISKSGLVHYYISVIKDSDGFGVQSTYGIECSTDEEERNERNNKKKQKPTLKTDGYIPPYWSIDELQKYLDDKGIPINIMPNLINFEGAIHVTPEDYSSLSATIKEHIRGNRQTVIQLLALRNKIKKLCRLSDFDDKYNSWMTCPEEKREEMILKCGELYQSDRESLYVDIAKFMAKYGDDWWD